MPVGPKVGNRHSNSQYHPPRQIPTISYNILQNTLSYNINQYQSISININQCQPISNNIDQYQSISTNINQYQTISININQYQPISTTINQYQSISTNINQYSINQYQSISYKEGSENRSCKILNFKVYAPPGQPSGLRSELAILSQAFL